MNSDILNGQRADGGSTEDIAAAALVAEQIENAEDRFILSSQVGHYLGGAEARSPVPA